MMICVVIKGPTFSEAFEQIKRSLPYADLVELRLDGFQSLDLQELRKLQDNFQLPFLFTLRSRAQGGGYSHSEEDRLNDIRRLASLRPDYFDLEYDLSLDFVVEIGQFSKVILSYHNFNCTPDNLQEIHQRMQCSPAFFYKIAVTAMNTLDAMRFMIWAKKTDGRLISISMGYYGQISRILAPLINSPMTYAALDDDLQSAPGQLSAQLLVELYRYRTLSEKTPLYGLIGDPVLGSISHKTHNHLFSTLNVEGVYVKLQVASSDLSDFISLAKKLPFYGLSVTMPLKESIGNLVDQLDPYARQIGAINTLVFHENTVIGYNTDGIGALNALEKQCLVKDKKIVIIGAGGAAKAIAYEAHQRGAIIVIVNRNSNKAECLAANFNGRGLGFDQMDELTKEGYDIIINSTPISMPIQPEEILAHALVMDIQTKPMKTSFLACAQAKGCRIVYGYQMFIEQAVEQFKLWLKPTINPQKYREILEHSVKENLFLL